MRSTQDIPEKHNETRKFHVSKECLSYAEAISKPDAGDIVQATVIQLEIFATNVMISPHGLNLSVFVSPVHTGFNWFSMFSEFVRFVASSWWTMVRLTG